MTDRELISIAEAAAQGVERVRKPIWHESLDHIKIDVHEGRPGPWLHLYCPFNKQCNGRDPVDILGIRQDYNEKCFLPYTGPLPTSEEYKAAVAAFDRFNNAATLPADQTDARLAGGEESHG